MEREEVTSGAIRSVGYDASLQILEIEFRNGRVYQYQSVPQSVHDWLLRSENKGGYLNRMVIPHYAEREVTAQPPTQPLEEALRASLVREEEPIPDD